MMRDIIHGDCLEGMRALAPQSLDIVVTSPPYNLDIKYGTYQDKLPRESYLLWLNDVFGEIQRVLKPQGHFWLNMGFSNVDPWVGMDVAQVARGHMVLQNNFTWVKSIAVQGEQIGHYKPINSERFANPTWEHLFHFTKTGAVPCRKTAIGVPYADEANVDKTSRWRGRIIKRMGFRDKRHFDALATPEQVAQLAGLLEAKKASAKPAENLHCPGSAWHVPYETISHRGAHRGAHPATFPVELVRRAIRFSGVDQGVLLDPFMGTGTSAVAAAREGLGYLGFDLDASYVAFALERLTMEVDPASQAGDQLTHGEPSDQGLLGGGPV